MGLRIWQKLRSAKPNSFDYWLFLRKIKTQIEPFMSIARYNCDQKTYLCHQYWSGGKTNHLVSSNHTLLIFDSSQSNEIGKFWHCSFSRMRAYRLKGSVKILQEIAILTTVRVHTFEPNLRTCNSYYVLETLKFFINIFFSRQPQPILALPAIHP